MQRLARRPTISSSKLAQFTNYLMYRAMTTIKESPPAPWRQLFVEHVQTMPSPEFTLSTVRKISTLPGPHHAPPDIYYSPRARTCVFRGMFAGLPVNPKNDAELNPDEYESDYLTFTTDCRMDKMAELMGVDPGREQDENLKLTRRGELVEAAFWVKDTATQWRVRGRAYVLGPDVDAPDADAVKAVGELLLRMRRKQQSPETGWSFGREVTAHFGNLSPLMRGSFRNPAPGTPVAAPVGDGRLKLGQKVTDLSDEVARANFRLVVIAPLEVDRTDLSHPARGRRWLYTYRGYGRREPNAPGGVVEDGWEKVEVWP
ncbi:pyridoxamine 5'-phosphate oxidase-domain-containing protein [Hypoxylon cercidicola]|nr:pyridoxamine 5'-phosphate oxidase-domain-containing protein [Hypoxylon cercidicola]